MNSITTKKTEQNHLETRKINRISDKALSCVNFDPLPRFFYERQTDIVARELLGKLLVRKINSVCLVGMIVETEAYFGCDDPASHACNGPTPRSAIMFGQPGISYIYLNYGVHYLLNAVTEEEGKAGAVLIRAIEPITGIEFMLKNRPVKKITDLTNGPGKLTKALDISIKLNGIDLTNKESELFMADISEICKDINLDISNFDICSSSRIGIQKGKEKLLRFYIKDNPYVSR